MAREVSSITRIGTSEPFELQVSRGQIAYHEFIHKFGYNPDIANSNETIWSQGGVYTYPTSASTMYISSSSTADTAAGTGARTATVSGLDANFDEISETVSLNGQAGVQLNGALNWSSGTIKRLCAFGLFQEGTLHIFTKKMFQHLLLRASLLSLRWYQDLTVAYLTLRTE